ncbi:uncharacterized protein RHOBADRAFT_42814 [Rhodotorula graminis WP1]|uniref:AN1-type domain-containing protein n=1 Tax=Rhodotorula graminis (strain WP1) TaxID=578459 RepID=A0A194S7F1_RHOGW|nr:uncharacterized protein RHOBADRAFT_42814 [Rhodotorula graminis WP1]KPV76474.1 hypothetical protein RHOBADRAFT_42814 [Rhodotorula graminis WP1]
MVPPPTNTGSPCAHCRHTEFLPLTCPKCLAHFCSTHAPPSNHACSASLSPPPPPSGQVDSPSLTSLLPDRDRHARLAAPEPPSPHAAALRSRQQAALAKFKTKAAASRSSSTTSSPARGPTTTAAPPPKPINPALALSRLKHRAAPLDPRHATRQGDVPLGERRFFSVRVGGSEADEGREVWAAKSISGGKALDLAADLLHVSNRNHLTTDPAQRLSLALSHPPDDALPPLSRIDLAQPLAAQVPDGACVVLLRGQVWA